MATFGIDASMDRCVPRQWKQSSARSVEKRVCVRIWLGGRRGIRGSVASSGGRQVWVAAGTRCRTAPRPRRPSPQSHMAVRVVGRVAGLRGGHGCRVAAGPCNRRRPRLGAGACRRTKRSGEPHHGVAAGRHPRGQVSDGRVRGVHPTDPLRGGRRFVCGGLVGAAWATVALAGLAQIAWPSPAAPPAVPPRPHGPLRQAVARRAAVAVAA